MVCLRLVRVFDNWQNNAQLMNELNSKERIRSNEEAGLLVTNSYGQHKIEVANCMLRLPFPARMLRRLKYNEDVESAIMADVPGWVPGASVMHNGKQWTNVSREELYRDFQLPERKEKWYAALFRN